MDLERDFAAWADRCDPDALTRVFDATAGRLLLLAVHLAGSRFPAEDLVQATFLAAMKRCGSWDRKRPLWPWLAAILHNEARMAWRRRCRRREVGIEAAGGAESTAPDPALLAASDEAFAAVVRAIDELPLPYRQVLRLRLVHGLQPVEIARALEVPVGTVRAQVHRGLARLREALPAGVAVAAGVLLIGEGALLAQVRARVLSEAAAMHAAAAGTPASLLVSGGWWIMHGKTWGLVAAGAALLVLLGLALGVPPGPDAGGAPGEPSPPVVADLDAGMAEPPAAAPDAAQRRVAEAAPGPAWPLVVTVRSSGGQTIGGVDVRVGIGAQGSGIEGIGDRLREDVARGETAADGTFQCSLDALRDRTALFRGTSYVSVSATHPFHDSRPRQHLLALPRTVKPRRFTAELELRPCFDIVGRVVDAGGRPVRGAALHWLPASSRFRSQELHERSGEAGSFRIAVPPDDPLERWRGSIAAVDPSLGTAVVALPAPAEPPAAGTTLDAGTLVLGGAAIRGQVVLGDGSPLGGFPLFVTGIDPAVAGDPAALRRSFHVPELRRRPQMREGRLAQVWSRPTTAADGTFVCAGLVPDALYAVAVRDTRMRMIPAVARAGGEPVRLVVDRQLLLVDVRDESGEALPGAHVVAEGFDPDAEWPPDRIRPGFPEKGLSVIARFYPADEQGRRMILSPFGWLWRIGSFDETALPDFLRHDAFPGVHRAEQRLVLRPETRFGSLHLAVVDEKGERFPAYSTSLKCLDRDIARNDRRSIPPADGMVRDLPAGRWRLTVYLGKELLCDPVIDAFARGVREQDIVIEDGRTTEVRIEAKPAGMVGFRLHSDASGESDGWKGLRIHSRTDGCEAAFHAIDGEHPSCRGPLFLLEPSFPPGRHAFLVTATGYHPARCEVEVVADELVRAVVELLPQ